MSNVPVLNLTEGYQTPEKTVQQGPMLQALQNIPIDKSVSKNKIYKQHIISTCIYIVVLLYK